MARITKREVVSNPDKWHIENLFWKRDMQKWWLRATNRETNEEIEFYITSTEYKKYRGGDKNRPMYADVD